MNIEDFRRQVTFNHLCNTGEWLIGVNGKYVPFHFKKMEYDKEREDYVIKFDIDNE